MIELARKTMRITILDDHVLFAEALALTFESEGYPVRRLDLTAPGASLATVLAAAVRSTPQIVLLDLDLGRLGDGTKLIDPLAAAGACVIVITADADPRRWGECMRRGAKTVVPKTRPLAEVVNVVCRAREGLPLMSVEERRRLIDLTMRDRADIRNIQARLDRLTRREMQILGALMRGEQVREIARRSFVAEATVRTQVKSILAKLETNSQLAAVGAAYKVSWRAPED